MTNQIKVLAIDDEVDFCYFIKKNLTQSGLFDVVVANNGADGIKLARKEKPDIILLDLFMPDIPGEDVAAELKDHPATADIPILYITALASNDEIVEGESNKMGDNLIMAKPVRTKKLIETIMKILGQSY